MSENAEQETPVVASPIEEETITEPAPSELSNSRPPRRRIADLEPGMELQGIVRSLQPYGAFVDVGAERDGLLHISQLGEGFVQRVDDVLHIGQSITTWVRDVDEQRGRIRLTMRVPGQSLAPRRKLSELVEGEEMEGRVASVTNFGAFIDIGAETDGLVHVSQMSDTHVDHPSDVVSRGERVRVRVINVDVERRRIGLTMRDVGRKPTDSLSASPSDEEEMPTVLEMAFREAQQNRERNA